MFDKMFPKKPTGKGPRPGSEFWRNVVMVPFERQSTDATYRGLIDVLEGIFRTPAYYVYVQSSSHDALSLEYMDIRRGVSPTGRSVGAQESLNDLLQNPEAQLHLDPDFQTLRFVEVWAGTFLTVPLLGEQGAFLGMILAGPAPARTLDALTAGQLQDYSIGVGATVSRMREIMKLREDLRIAATRARVTQRVLGSALEVDRFVSLLLDLALTASKTEAGFVAIARQDTLTIRASKNLPPEFLAQVNLSAKDGLFEWSHDADDVLILQDFEFVARFGIRSVLAVPLVENGRLHGVFALINFAGSTTFEDQSLTILKSFCEQIKLVLNNSKLFEDFTQRYLETLKALSDSYDVRSPYGAGHSKRVATVAVKLGKLLGLDADRLNHLELSAAVHDVGMCGVVEIKSGFRADFNHPTIGASLVEVVPISPEVAEAVRTHHEWFDGWGYPDGLKGEAIPLLGRILAVAEYYEEIQSGSHHEKERAPGMLDEDLQTRSGTQFDPRVVDALKQMLRTT
jgi:GAF domain-containing protein